MFYPSKILLVFLIAISVCGCSKPEFDIEGYNQSRIEKSMESNVFNQVDAIVFLQKGGAYIDEPEFSEVPLDQPHVLPVLETLRDDFGLEWIALVDRDIKQARAYDIVTKIPAGVSKRQVQDRLVELQQDFPGDILQSWGEEWFSIDFLNAEEAAFLNEDSES